MIERRKTYFVEKSFQVRFILKFCLLVLLGSLFFVGIIYLLVRGTSVVTFSHAKAKILTTQDFLFPILVQTVFIVTVVISFFTILLTLLVSHKISGPLYRLKKELDIMGKGILPEDFCIRKKDQLQDLAISVSSMVKTLRERISNLKRDFQDLKESFRAKEDITEKIQKIDSILEYFKF